MEQGGTISLELPDGRSVELPVLHSHFSAWTGTPPPRTFGAKPVVEHNGTGVFPEIAAVQLLKHEGWNAVWASTYGGLRFFAEQPTEGRSNTIDLPDLAHDRLDQIAAMNGTWAGTFDVVAWSDEQLLFTELKRRGRDSVRSTQRQWLASALSLGYGIENFQILEWDLLPRK